MAKDHSNNAYISRHVRGGARTSRFLVEFTFPTAMQVDAEMGDFMTYSCRAATLPESTIGTVGNIWFMGRQIKQGGDRDYPDWTCTFVADDAQRVRNLMVRWSDIMNGHESNVMTGTGNIIDYYGSARVIQLNNVGDDESEGNSVIINNIYPTIIAGIDYDWSDQNNVATFTCTFAINSIRIDGVTT